MSHQDDIKKLISHHSRRLQKLKEQQALEGISVDPKILIEIEDIEAQIDKLQLRIPKERNRYFILSNVRHFWIEGVLEKSVYNTGFIELGMRQEFGEVLNPWDKHLQTHEVEEMLPPRTHILDMFNKFNGKMLILGDPGSGKTTMLLTLARDLLERAEADEAHPIPIIFTLSSWAEKQLPLQEWLMDELRNQYQVGHEVADHWLENDQIQLLLDGLDEVDKEYRDGCVEAINMYRQDHGLIDIIVCARTIDYKDLSNKLHLNGAIVLEPLTDEQVDLSLAKASKEMNGVHQLLKEDKVLGQMSRSPLMLSILTMAYHDLSADTLPRFKTVTADRNYIFEMYVKRMFERHRQSPYSQEATIHYLKWLACKMQDHSQSVFLIEKMQPGWLTTNQRQRYKFFVRLLKIPLTALVFGLPCLFIPATSGFQGWLLGLLLAVVGVVVSWVYTGQNWNKLKYHGVIGLSYGLAWGLSAIHSYGTLNGLILGLGIAIVMTIAYHVTTKLVTQGFNEDTISVVEKLNFSFKKMKPTYGWAGLIIGSMGVLSAFTVVGQDDISRPEVIVRVIVSVVIGGVVLGAFWLLNSGISSTEVSLHQRPNEGILRAFRNSYIAFFITTVMYLLYTLVAIAPVTSLDIGLLAFLGVVGANGFPFWFIYGGFNTVQHFILRTTLWHDDVIPFSYARFLDHASRLIFMRKVGGGYIFIHRYLLEYFASEINDPKQEGVDASRG
jgi:hypothetical protein